MSASHICKCHKCGYEENVWYDDEQYGYVPVCLTKGCENEGGIIYDEESIINHQHQDNQNENYSKKNNLKTSSINFP